MFIFLMQYTNSLLIFFLIFLFIILKHKFFLQIQEPIDLMTSGNFQHIPWILGGNTLTFLSFPFCSTSQLENTIINVVLLSGIRLKTIFHYLVTFGRFNENGQKRKYTVWRLTFRVIFLRLDKCKD
jgi:hypothetical protein